MIRSIGKMMITVGGVGFLAALVWWFSFFHQMLGKDVKRASECFYSTTVECSLADAVGLFMDVPPYQPGLLWFAGATIALGFLVAVFAPE